MDFSGIIRVNSQSGKAGAAHLLAQARGVTLPRWLEPEFAREVQQTADQGGHELSGPEVAAVFDRTMLHPPGGVVLTDYRMTREERCRVTLQLQVDGVPREVCGEGNGPIDAACHALPGQWRVRRYEERAMNPGSDARAVAFVTLAGDESCAGCTGAGIHEDIVAASLHALVAACNRHVSHQEPAARARLLAAPLHWDAAAYAAHSENQFQHAMMRIAAMGLMPGESVLDVGCGDGKITAELARRVQPGRVLGIDAAPEMIRLARARFPASDYPNLTFAVMDAREIRVAGGFDRVFSNAALHWIKDHGPVLQGIAGALRPGGRFHLDMGGRGNADRMFQAIDLVSAREPWSAWIGGMANPYGFHDAESYRVWLEANGLIGRRVALVPRLWTFPSQEHLAGWVRTTWLPYTQRIPEARREAFVNAVVAGYAALFPPDPTGAFRIGMVRLEVEGERP